jgi:DnaJ-class molecular chaperone
MGGRDEPICDECDGTGEIVTRKGVEVTCPVCRGTGVAR